MSTGSFEKHQVLNYVNLNSVFIGRKKSTNKSTVLEDLSGFLFGP